MMELSLALGALIYLPILAYLIAYSCAKARIRAQHEYNVEQGRSLVGEQARQLQNRLKQAHDAGAPRAGIRLRDHVSRRAN